MTEDSWPLRSHLITDTEHIKKDEDKPVDGAWCGKLVEEVCTLSWCFLHPVTEKRSQYTFPHIFSKRGTIVTIFAVLMPPKSVT